MNNNNNNNTAIGSDLMFDLYVSPPRTVLSPYNNNTTSNTTSSRTASGKKRGRPFAKGRGGARSERGSGDTFKEVQFAEEEEDEGGKHLIKFIKSFVSVCYHQYSV